VRRVEIPFENGKTIPGILQTVPACRKHPACSSSRAWTQSRNTCRALPQSLPPARHGHTVDRRPGQGESNIRETWVTLDNFERAGSAAIDFLETRPEIDASRVGAYGWSMGSYWAPRIAAHDPRVKAVVGAMGVYQQKDTIFMHGKARLSRELHVHVEYP